MDQKIKKIWIEVGLAVALVVCLGLLGAKMGVENEKRNTKIVKAVHTPMPLSEDKALIASSSDI